jgi:hypothetical protein
VKQVTIGKRCRRTTCWYLRTKHLNSTGTGQQVTNSKRMFSRAVPRPKILKGIFTDQVLIKRRVMMTAIRPKRRPESVKGNLLGM